MSNIPNEVKEIRTVALEKAFKKDIDTLNDDAKDVLLKVMDYMEQNILHYHLKHLKKFASTN